MTAHRFDESTLAELPRDLHEVISRHVIAMGRVADRCQPGMVEGEEHQESQGKLGVDREPNCRITKKHSMYCFRPPAAIA